MTASMWVILSIILLIVLLVMALRPTLVTISGLLGQIRQEKEVVAKLNNKIALVTQAMNEMDSVSGERHFLDKALPVDADWKGMADTLTQTATTSSLVITDLVIDKIPLTLNEELTTNGQKYVPQMPQGVMPVRFTLTLAGDYTQMRQAITNLENWGRIIMITSINRSIDKKGMLIMVINGEAGYLPDSSL